MKLTKIFTPIAMTLALSGGIFILTGCKDENPNSQPKQIPTLPVHVYKVEPVDYTIKTVLPGRVVASRVAEIRPQVSGIILKREFIESTDVKAGQSLYQIDPAIYQATYDSAVANLASVQAKANIAQLTLNRYKGLLATKSISQQDYDQAAADLKQAMAQVMVAQANVNSAKVNLDYTKVYSPIDGYIGKSNVTEGALVSAGQTTPMALVQQLDPIYIDMTQAVIKYEQNGQNKGTLYQAPEKTKVELFFSDGTKFQQEGYIKFSDKTVSETTGTVTLRAEFANPPVIDKNGSQQRRLLPGMFVKPVVTLGTIKNAILVPQKGITSNVNGQYTAKVVNEQGLVEQRDNVKVYAGVKNYWIVTEGINIGDQIIVSGLMNLSAIPAGVPVKANILGTESLTQQQVNEIIAQNTK
jgi:membrane fusion protein, multidrug efflux system